MSKCNYSIKCRIYPNDSQIVMIEKTFGCVRKIWNLMLNDRNNIYKKDKTIYKPRPAMYKDEYPYLKEVDSLALTNAQLNLEKAFNDNGTVKITNSGRLKFTNFGENKSI